MKIPLTCGESEIIVDTNQLTDKDAAIHEAIKNLYDTCLRYDITCFLRVILDNKKYIGMQTVPKNEKKVSQDYASMVSEMCGWIEKTTGGRLKVIETDGPELI